MSVGLTRVTQRHDPGHAMSTFSCRSARGADACYKAIKLFSAYSQSVSSHQPPCRRRPNVDVYLREVRIYVTAQRSVTFYVTSFYVTLRHAHSVRLPLPICRTMFPRRYPGACKITKTQVLIPAGFNLFVRCLNADVDVDAVLIHATSNIVTGHQVPCHDRTLSPPNSPCPTSPRGSPRERGTDICYITLKITVTLRHDRTQSSSCSLSDDVSTWLSICTRYWYLAT